MSKAKKGLPHQQPFNVSPRPNKTKRREVSWWGHPPYHNNGTPKTQKGV